MDYWRKASIATIVIYIVLSLASMKLWPVRNVWVSFIDGQPELFVGLLVIAIAGLIFTSGGSGAHK